MHHPEGSTDTQRNQEQEEKEELEDPQSCIAAGRALVPEMETLLAEEPAMLRGATCSLAARSDTNSMSLERSGRGLGLQCGFGRKRVRQRAPAGCPPSGA